LSLTRAEQLICVAPRDWAAIAPFRLVSAETVTRRILTPSLRLSSRSLFSQSNAALQAVLQSLANISFL